MEPTNESVLSTIVAVVVGLFLGVCLLWIASCGSSLPVPTTTTTTTEAPPVTLPPPVEPPAPAQ